MSEVSAGRAITDLLFRRGVRRPERLLSSVRPVAVDAGRVQPTKAFQRFLSILAQREAPLLLDLGPVVGDNVAFFGEQLGCKILIEDLYVDLARFGREQRLDEFPAFLEERLAQVGDGVDGILCWDLFDFLPRPAAQTLARQLTRLLKPGGVLLGFFSTAPAPAAEYVKYVVVDASMLRQRPHLAGGGRRGVFLNRDINKMFDGLSVSESFLLLTKTREILFKKVERASQPRLVGT